MKVKNPIPAFRRASVNHPGKLEVGCYALGGSAMSLLLLPFDGGLSFTGAVITTVVTLWAAAEKVTYHDRSDHNEIKLIHHNGRKFEVTKAQKYAYGRLAFQIKSLEQDYKKAGNEKERKDIAIHAQYLADFQEDILDSKNVRDITNRPIPDQNQNLNVNYRNRGPGN